MLASDEPRAGYIAHDYKIVVRDEKGKKVFDKKVVNDYYVIREPVSRIRLGNAVLEESKKYTVKIIAESAYHLRSETKTFTFAQAEKTFKYRFN